MNRRDAVVATCVRALPNEGCGVLIGNDEGVVVEVWPSTNISNSAKIYEIEPLTMLRASRRADDLGLEVIGVFHSHTHSDAYPSPTDILQAPDPSWHYLLVSLRLVPSVLRSFRIINGRVTEEPVTLVESR